MKEPNYALLLQSLKLMPEQDGIQVLTELRQSSYYEGLNMGWADIQDQGYADKEEYVLNLWGGK